MDGLRAKKRLRLLLPLLLVVAAVTTEPCSITSYGARCDNSTDDAPAIQRALDDVASCPTVLIPAAHSCVSRALNLTRMSGRSLLIAGDLIIWRTPSTYKRPGDTKVNMFLSATSGDGAWTGPLLSDFTLAGGGRVLGGGAAWWPGGGDQRPRTVWLPNSTRLTVANLTLVDSPAWNVGVRGDTIHISGMRIEAGLDSCGGFGHAPNTDGFNVGGHGITVSDSVVHNGDDCVPITTGNDGSTSNVLVENVSCECGTNGVVVYNQGGTVRDVFARNVTSSNTNQGAGVKLARPGVTATGGLVKNITFSHYTINLPRFSAMYVNVFQEDAQPPCVLPSHPNLTNWLVIQDMRFEHLRATVPAGQAAGCFRCTPGAPCNAAFDDVRVVETGTGHAAGAFVCLNMKGDGGASVPAGCAP